MRRTLTQNPIHTIDKVRVNLGVRSYDILIGQGLLANIPSLFANVAQSTSFFVVCDEHVQEDAALVAKGFKNQNINATIAQLAQLKLLLQIAPLRKTAAGVWH